jgi:N-methylhydantoinase A
MKLTINIDTGGTFTDGFFTGDGQMRKVKVDTTPHDLTECFRNCIEEGAKSFDLTVSQMMKNVDVVRFSSTIGSNIMIEKSGAKVGLIVSKRFENSIYGEEQQQNPLFDFILSPPMVRGIDEGVDDKGNITKAPDEEEVRGAVKQLLQRGARVIVVSLLRASINDANELRVREIVTGAYPSHFLGAVPVLLSTEVSASTSDALRTNTAVVNAYLHRDMVRFLYRADAHLRNTGYRKPMLVVHSGGGTARAAKTVAVETWGSGPAGGLAGAASVSALYGIENAVSVDIGGTSTDIGLIVKGRYGFNYQPEIEGIRLSLPIIELISIEGGGGSIVTPKTDSKAVRVGPKSAGALPGPVAYDLGGTEPTVTDACLVLGYINPDYFLGGRRKLNLEKARQVIQERVAAPLGLSLEQASYTILKEMTSLATDAIFSILSKAGVPARDCTMLALGGGGGTFCYAMAQRIGIAKVYFSHLSPVFSAFGLSTMDVVHRYESAKSVALKSGASDYLSRLNDFNEVVASLKGSALRDMRGEGFDPEKVTFSLELEMASPDGSRLLQSPRFLLQSAEDVKAVCDAYTGQFHLAQDEDIVVQLFRINASAAVLHYQFPSHNDAGESPEEAYKTRRKIYWDDSFIEAKIYEHKLLKSGNRVLGPAIIEAEDTTMLVPPGGKYTVDKFLGGSLEVE